MSTSIASIKIDNTNIIMPCGFADECGADALSAAERRGWSPARCRNAAEWARVKAPARWAAMTAAARAAWVVAEAAAEAAAEADFRRVEAAEDAAQAAMEAAC